MARAHRHDPRAPHLGIPPRLPSPQHLPPLRGDATLIRPPTCGARLVAQVVDWGVDKRKPPPDEPEVQLGRVSERRNHINPPARVGNRRGHKLTRSVNHTAALMDQAATRATHRVGALVTHRIVASNRQTALHQLKLTPIERDSRMSAGLSETTRNSSPAITTPLTARTPTQPRSKTTSAWQ